MSRSWPSSAACGPLRPEPQDRLRCGATPRPSRSPARRLDGGARRPLSSALKSAYPAALNARSDASLSGLISARRDVTPRRGASLAARSSALRPAPRPRASGASPMLTSASSSSSRSSRTCPIGSSPSITMKSVEAESASLWANQRLWSSAETSPEVNDAALVVGSFLHEAAGPRRRALPAGASPLRDLPGREGADPARPAARLAQRH